MKIFKVKKGPDKDKYRTLLSIRKKKKVIHRQITANKKADVVKKAGEVLSDIEKHTPSSLTFKIFRDVLISYRNSNNGAGWAKSTYDNLFSMVGSFRLGIKSNF